MVSQRITGITTENFYEKIENSQLTLLYPWASYRNAFMSFVVDNSDRLLIYYRIADDDLSLSEVMMDMTETLQGDVGDFPALRGQIENSDVTAWGDALAKDLNAFAKNEPIWFFLDEMDRLPHDSDLNQFVVALVDGLSSDVHLVISSRLLKYQPWYDFVVDGKAVVFGTERRAHDLMYTILDEPKPPLEVYALGRGMALANGQEITNWDGALPRNLFFYFMDSPLVTRDEIFDRFWPKLSTKEATNVFHVTKRKISERITMKIDEPGNYELTQYSAGFYKPSEKVVRYYDVHEFEEAVNQSMVAIEEEEEEELLRRAIDLYKGDFLLDGKMEWMATRREDLKQQYAQALIGMGRICAGRGDQMTALGYYVRALRETPGREDIHRDVMSIYIEQGMPDDARNQYQHMEKILNENLKIGPSRESRELYEQIADA